MGNQSCLHGIPCDPIDPTPSGGFRFAGGGRGYYEDDARVVLESIRTFLAKHGLDPAFDHVEPFSSERP